MSLLGKAEETSIVSLAMFPSMISNCRRQTVIVVTCYMQSLGNAIGNAGDFPSCVFAQLGLSLSNECTKVTYCPQGFSCHGSQYSAQNGLILLYS